MTKKKSKNTVIHKKLQDTVFFSHIEVFIGEPKESRAKIKKVFGVDIHEISIESDGISQLLKNKDGSVGHVIWIRYKTMDTHNIATIAHECLHCTRDVMEHVGIPMTEESDEAWTYYQGGLLIQILELLKKK